MFWFVREFISSVKNPHFFLGNSPKIEHSLRLWVSWVIFSSIIPFLVFIGYLTYYTPQIPGTIINYFPDAWISLKSGNIFSSLSYPFRFQSENFTLVIDPAASEEELSDQTGSVLVLSDRLIIRTQSETIQTLKFSSLPDFSLSRNQVVDWIQNHLFLVWATGLLVILTFALFFGAFYFTYKFITFLGLAGLAWFYFKIGKKPQKFRPILVIVVYASIASLLVEVFLPFPGTLVWPVSSLAFALLLIRWLLPFWNKLPSVKI
jgi:hypothetical protein